MITKSTILTREERDVLVLVALHPRNEHRTDAEIGELLGMSTSKVKTLIHQACIKLEAHTRNEAVIFAMRRGEIRVDELFSLDELAEFLAALDPYMVRTILDLVRQKLEYGRLQTKNEQGFHIDRQQDATPTREGTILTERERDIVILVARGLTNKEIADRLYISVCTVRNMLNNASTKLGACTRCDTAVLALKQGEISGGEIFSLNEIVELLAPLGPEAIETIDQLLSQKLEQERVRAVGQWNSAYSVTTLSKPSPSYSLS